MLAQECDLLPRFFIHTIGDAHLYMNHLDGVKKQLERKPKIKPTVEIQKKPFFELTFSDFELQGYEHDPFIKFEVAV